MELISRVTLDGCGEAALITVVAVIVVILVFGAISSLKIVLQDALFDGRDVPWFRKKEPMARQRRDDGNNE